MAASPLDGDLGEALVGALLGIGAALFAQYVFVWRNRRWSWALLPAGAGLVVTAGAWIVESWLVGLAVGGLLTARWVFLLERVTARQAETRAGGRARPSESVTLSRLGAGAAPRSSGKAGSCSVSTRAGGRCRCASAASQDVTGCWSARRGRASRTRCCGR